MVREVVAVDDSEGVGGELGDDSKSETRGIKAFVEAFSRNDQTVLQSIETSFDWRAHSSFFFFCFLIIFPLWNY